MDENHLNADRSAFQNLPDLGFCLGICLGATSEVLETLLPLIGYQSVGGADDVVGSRGKGVVLGSLLLIGVHVTGILVG